MLTYNVRTIEFYRTETGKSPVEEFLDSLPDKHARKVTWVLRLVERLDFVPKQYLKKIIELTKRRCKDYIQRRTKK